MLKPVEATVLVDLSDVGVSAREFQGNLLFDHNDQPVELELSLAGLGNDLLTKALNGKADEFLGGKQATVRVPGRPEINTTVAIVSNISFNSAGQIVARCFIARTESGTSQHPDQGGQWVFKLTNVKLHRCDEKTETPPPPGVPEHLRGWKLDRIPFAVAGRTWELKDEMVGQRNKQRARDVHVPLITATLSTAVQPGDTSSSICEAADAIAALLTLALARSVRAVKIEQIDVEGASVWWSVRNLMVFPFSKGGFAPVDNWEIGTLRSFLDCAYPIVASDRRWWLTTLDMFMQVHVNPYLETKAMLLNVLADRVAAKLGVASGCPEIDSNLDSRIDEAGFKRALHALLGQLSDKWTEERTRNLVSTIKTWNARPSFTEGIRRACRAVGLKPPPTKLLGTRHRLIHVGELHPPAMTLEDYWKELEALVLLLILRMLNYEGSVYVAKFGDSKMLLRDYLESYPSDAGGRSHPERASSHGRSKVPDVSGAQ